MPEFLKLLPPEIALKTWLDALQLQTQSEFIPLADALDRVTASSIAAPHPLPEFPRSTVDGFALSAEDTYGASASLPVYLELAGEIHMGVSAGLELNPGQCALIHTGGMLPTGANAVVMVEVTQFSSEGEVEIQRAVAVGENVIRVGEDVASGDVVIPTGRRLLPAEIGGLAALGIQRVEIARRPRVAIISSGDEIIPVDTQPTPGQVRDVNSHTLAALITQAGGQPIQVGIIPDRLDILTASIAEVLQQADAVVITAGSSASQRDLTADAINSLGSPGVLVHGVNIRPGKPTILAVCDGKPVLGLPGNPVSALVIADLFLRPVLNAYLGLDIPPSATIPATLTVNLASVAGREDWFPVQLLPGEDGYQAGPIFGKSNLIFTLARADGLIRIPADSTGLQVGETVDVYLRRI